MNDNKTLKSTWAAGFAVASVWFGTHVGGGFASGNQVVQYFSSYGPLSIIFPILAMGLLAVVMYIMVKFAKLSGFTNYKDTYAALYPKPWMEIFFEIFYWFGYFLANHLFREFFSKLQDILVDCISGTSKPSFF